MTSVIQNKTNAQNSSEIVCLAPPRSRWEKFKDGAARGAAVETTIVIAAGVLAGFAVLWALRNGVQLNPGFCPSPLLRGMADYFFKR